MNIIFSDLDGTLLQRGEASLNKNIKNSIYSYLAGGNVFSVASGRNYIELRHIFSDFKDDIYFICNDGGLGVFRETTFFEAPMNKKLFEDFKGYTAHGKYVTYVKSDSNLFIRKAAEKYRGHIMTVDSICDIEEPIYKISDFDKSIPCHIPVVYKDYSMNEYIAETANKACVAHHLMNMLKIPNGNAYAFGDNVNDTELFKVCGTSLAVANALPTVKKCASRVIYNIEEEIIKLI